MCTPVTPKRNRMHQIMSKVFQSTIQHMSGSRVNTLQPFHTYIGLPFSSSLALPKVTTNIVPNCLSLARTLPHKHQSGYICYVEQSYMKMPTDIYRSLHADHMCLCAFTMRVVHKTCSCNFFLKHSLEDRDHVPSLCMTFASENPMAAPSTTSTSQCPD